MTDQPTVNKFADALDSLTGNAAISGGFRSLVQIFALNGIGWDEIERLQAIHPDAADAIRAAHVILLPSPVIQGHGHQLETFHLAHCRELLHRVIALHNERPEQLASFLAGEYKATGKVEDVLALATDPEMCIHYMKTSMVAPLTTVGTLCYMNAFRSVFGEETAVENGLITDGLVDLFGRDAEQATARARKQSAISRRPQGAV